MSFLSNLFGPSKAQNVQFSPAGFNAGGLSSQFLGNAFGGGSYATNPSAERLSAVGNVASTFGQQAQDIAGLRKQFTPGFSDLRNSLMTSLQNNRSQGLNNLRDNLAQRRVLGSSFAQNSLANADQTYQQQIQQIQAQTFLQELSAQQQLSQQQFTAARGQFQTGLDEMNLEAGITADLTGKATSALASAANTQTQLNIANAKLSQDYTSGIGSFLGKTLGGPISGAFSGGLSDMLAAFAGAV